MPIDLSQLNTTSITDVTPKYFSQKLTGSGKKIGLLNENLDPSQGKKFEDWQLSKPNIETIKESYKNGNATYTAIPFYILPPKVIENHISQLNIDPDALEILDTGKVKIKIQLKAHSLCIHEVSDQNKSVQKTYEMTFRAMIWVIGDPSCDKALTTSHGIQRSDGTHAWINIQNAMNYAELYEENYVLTSITFDPVKWFQPLKLHLNPTHPDAVTALEDFLQNASTYEMVKEASNLWQNHIHDILEPIFEELALNHQKNKNIEPILQLVQYLESYEISLELYQHLYNSVHKNFQEQDRIAICSQNINFLLSDTLNNLDQNKHTLNSVPSQTPPIQVDPYYSPEQARAIETKEPLVLVQAGAGTGKAQPLDEPVLTNKGWKPMGDLDLNDLVIGSDGKPHKLKAIHERGLQEGYLITFSDGSQTRAAGDHLWTVHTNGHKKVYTKTLTTQEILDQSNYNRFYIPQTKAIEWPKKDFEIPPYIIGYELNDRELSRTLIPEKYFYGSVAQRKALVSGMFDSRGYTHEESTQAVYPTPYEDLADQLLQLLWSLGLVASKNLKKGKIWEVKILTHDYNPFLKDEINKGYCVNKRYARHRFIKSIEPIEPTPMRCIEIDAPDHLYITKDYIVTHNSSTILARIDYMIESGIEPKDITVLSFTNAAANNILDRNPNVHSMTIASMVHQIYTQNHPTHKLSTLDTLANSLDIYYPNNEFVENFRKAIYKVLTNKPNAFISLNNFIEAHYDSIIETLDHIQQTALELEIMICYQQIGNFIEPPGVASEHLIIDEVQDNSIFEFIYTLKYVEKNRQSLYIVGDCSQTLYEFRASNPKALNILEASGVFQTYQLQTNYRSNQEILDFANLSLSEIEANQFAQIQLQSNRLHKVNLDSFKDKVFLEYDRLPRYGDFDDRITYHVGNTLRFYIDNCLKKGEQVAVLAYTRKHVRLMEEALSKTYPNRNIVSLVPEKTYNSTIFSSYIQKYWKSLQFSQSQHIMITIAEDILKNARNLVRNKYSDQIVQGFLDKWMIQSRDTINKYYQQYKNNILSHTDFMEAIKENMLEYEIRHNGIRQSLTSSRNEELRRNNVKDNADILLSTIHSAKGLEFENTIVIYQARKDMNEESKRMYYVALTRAMNSEFILAYGTQDHPKIQKDHEHIIEQLAKKAKS